MPWKISKEFEFDFGHRVWSQSLNKEFSLENSCKCRFFHGHRGKIVVFLSSESLTNGMVTDFKHLNIFKKFVDDVLDHKFIFDIKDPVLPFELPDNVKFMPHLKMVELLKDFLEDTPITKETNTVGTLQRRNKKGQLHSLYSPAVEDVGGYKAWYQNDKLHREDGPAIEFANGDKYWYQNGKQHRTDGPAVEYADGYKSWYQNGNRHRTDGPAEEFPNGAKYWYQNGKRHRENGPAVEYANGDKSWYQNDKQHRIDGPAVELANGYKAWWLDGNLIGKSEEGFTDANFEQYKKDHNITASKFSWGVYDDDFTTEKTNTVGTLERRNKEGQLHSLYSPAIEYADGSKEWYQNGKLHRTDGPAVEYADGDKEWYQNGNKHRINGPAVEDANGYKAWYQNGNRHRTDGPAIEYANGSKSWYQNDKQHRIDGPAVEDVDGYKSWWLNDEFIGRSEGGFTDANFEQYKRDHNITASKFSWKVYDDDFTTEEINEFGTLQRRNKKGQLHSLYSPAIKYANGDKYWYQNGKYHRTNGPAVEYANGAKYWYQNGKLHRTEGPAVEYADGDKEWWLNGNLIGKSRDGFTDANFEQYKRDHNITAGKFSWKIYDDDFTTEETNEDGTLERRNKEGQLHSLYSPAIEYADGDKYWYQNGKIYRTDGPAVEYADGDKEWWLNGNLIGKSRDGFTDADFEQYKRDHNITASKSSLNDTLGLNNDYKISYAQQVCISEGLPYVLREKLEGLVFVDFVPTAENLSQWLFNILIIILKSLPVHVDSVEFFETPKSKSRFSLNYD